MRDAPANPFADEESITWTVPAAELPRYVREIHLSCLPRRRGPVRYGEFKVVGWANLHPTAPSEHGHFRRRVFFLKQTDPYEPTGAPAEAVDPRTVAAGVAGKQTDQVWGNPPAQGASS